MAIRMSKYFEHSDINLKFNYDFKLENITTEMATELFSIERL